MSHQSHARREFFSDKPPAATSSKADFRNNYSGANDTDIDSTVNGYADRRDKVREHLLGSSSAAGANSSKFSARSTDSVSTIASRRTMTTESDASGYVGFANLPNQVHRRAVKKGFDYSLMVVGASGTGKSTFINTLFQSDIYNAEHPGPSYRPTKTLEVETTKVLLREGTVEVRLNIIDTPGFGDCLDNSSCWKPLVESIENRYNDYLTAESRVLRVPFTDNRVHCCLYFINPTGHGLSQLDIETMRRLHDKVNVIPLIAKADTLTTDEVREFKKQILNEIRQNNIQIYEFPPATSDTEAEQPDAGQGDRKRATAQTTKSNPRDKVPFAVIGSNYLIEVNGKRVRGRQYPWGVVEVENIEHNDFLPLREMLIRMYMQDLIDVTANVHYENYRFQKLALNGPDGHPKPGSTDMSPLGQIEEEKKEYDKTLKKMEAEMEQVLEMKVKDKLQKLKDSEVDLQKREESMKQSLEKQRRDLEEKRQQFTREKEDFDQLYPDSQTKSLEGKDRDKKKGKLF